MSRVCSASRVTDTSLKVVVSPVHTSRPVALAEVFGVTGDPAVIARLCQEAEHRSGVPVGAMDPLVCAGGRRGYAMLIDFSSLDIEQVPIPPDCEFVVVDSGRPRTLSDH